MMYGSTGTGSDGIERALEYQVTSDMILYFIYKLNSDAEFYYQRSVVEDEY